MADTYPDKNIAIIKYAHGGSNLQSNWAAGGLRYNVFISTVSDEPVTCSRHATMSSSERMPAISLGYRRCQSIIK